MSTTENRPGATNTGAASTGIFSTNTNEASLPNLTPSRMAMDAFRGAYAVLVQGARTRRHLYLNLPAAVRAQERAAARGDRAELVLVRLEPVDGQSLSIEGGDQ